MYAAARDHGTEAYFRNLSEKV
ncbi:MAG TPA: hypothetical protein VLL97_06525, partial [Acidobacteriota bacterium]|nr:hypothetical protein [Acidobacteriota bacterium]